MVIVNPIHRSEIQEKIEQYSSFISGRNAVYISGPISSGGRYLWHIANQQSLINKNRIIDELQINRIRSINLDVIKKFKDWLESIEHGIILEPASFDIPGWTQNDYLYFWSQIISRYVKRIIFLDDWYYSNGCVYEYLIGLKNNLELVDQNLMKIDRHKVIALIKSSIDEHKLNNLEVKFQESVLEELEKLNNSPMETKFAVDVKNEFRLKDEVLNYISSEFNVAQFASFAPDLKPRYSRIYGCDSNYQFPTIEETIQVLINNSQDKSINIRTFKPGVLKGNPFYYGIKDVNKAIGILNKSSDEGFYAIVNETIDIDDGGVSGVVMNGIMEFSPGDTPKCVEKPGICALPRKNGLSILNTIYGFTPNLDFQDNLRVEFSIHPKRRGFRKEHTIIWEIEQAINYHTDFSIEWPNNFSRFIGDKAFGLLIADELGAMVPKTIALTRTVAPFSFGTDTGLSEIWLRTCPSEKTPGKYPTYFGWKDPFEVINNEELFTNVRSILSQQSVEALFSGAMVPKKNGLLIEGVKGFGDDFMIGKQSPVELPQNLKKEINELYNLLSKDLGEISFEWVYDGRLVWIVQLMRSTALSTTKIIYPGKVSNYLKFNVEEGLEALREKIKSLDKDTGIELIGNIGITSHFGDILRNLSIPSKLKK